MVGRNATRAEGVRRSSYVDALLEAIGSSRRFAREISIAAVGHASAVRNLKQRRDIRASTLEALCRELGLEFYIGPRRDALQGLEALEACESAIGGTLRRERGQLARFERNARRPPGCSPAGKHGYVSAMLEAAGTASCRIRILEAARDAPRTAIGRARGK